MRQNPPSEAICGFALVECLCRGQVCRSAENFASAPLLVRTLAHSWSTSRLFPFFAWYGQRELKVPEACRIVDAFVNIVFSASPCFVDFALFHSPFTVRVVWQQNRSVQIPLCVHFLKLCGTLLRSLHDKMHQIPKQRQSANLLDTSQSPICCSVISKVKLQSLGIFFDYTAFVIIVFTTHKKIQSYKHKSIIQTIFFIFYPLYKQIYN